ncbi:MAG: histidinol-phosphatase [Desulfobulbaceae bacterium]|jgi:histidinol-phosphatase (PHP family)|nr:histidinol-phosphatase [Desulfobulbaceae bacterium]
MEFVSVHGGHSGQFCSHAENSLEEIILAYISHGYAWVGVTEHAPGLTQNLLYTDQQNLGFTPESLWARFARYMPECRRLQAKYANEITIFAAMETETYSGYEEHIKTLIAEFRPDYIVGSVHFVGDINFDYSPEKYAEAAATVGGVEHLYCQYFDDQLAMIDSLRPAVVGHFDLVRIFDRDYPKHLALPAVAERIERNLRRIKELDLIMDFNLRALYKGASEPYISRPILVRAKELGIAVAPGDDSHGLANIHQNMERGIAILADLGFDTNWRRPRPLAYP